MSNANCLPFTGFNHEIQELPTLLPKLGFRPLNSATPADLPAGAIVVLYNIKTFSFETVVARALQNGVLFYAHQTGLSHDSWYNTMFGDISRTQYLYKVLQ